MKSLLWVVLPMAFIALTAPGVVAGAGQNSTVHEARQTSTFGTLGIVTGQTVRVSAFRAPNQDLDVNLCGVELDFFDINGNPQATAQANLDPGKGTFLDLPFASVAPPPSSPRAEISATVNVVSNARDGVPACHVATSVEIFDQATGRTSTSEKVSSQKDVTGFVPSNNCPVPCDFETSSCPGELDCWQIPSTLQFACCRDRPP